MLVTVSRRSTPIAAALTCLALGATLFAGAAGCGSSSANSPGGGGGGASGNGTLTWQDDGVAHQAPFATASLVSSSGLQILQITGGEASGIGIAFGVSAKPTVGLGVFQCGPAAGGYPITSFSYTATGVAPLYESCTVSITALGAARGESASGTFSAVLDKTGGGTKAITAGIFNAALTVSP